MSAGEVTLSSGQGGGQSRLTLVTVVVLSPPFHLQSPVRKRAQKELGEPVGSRQSGTPTPLPRRTSFPRQCVLHETMRTPRAPACPLVCSHCVSSTT